MRDHDHLPEFLSLRDIKRDILVVLARDGAQHGLAIKRRLDERMNTDINPSRLYPNLDELAEQGYIEKGHITQRANRYELTRHGKRALSDYHSWLTDGLDNPSATRPLQRLARQELNAPGESDE